MAATKKLELKLDVETAVALHGDFSCLLSENQDVILDCSAVTGCSSAAAQLLVSFSKTLQSSGHALTVAPVSDAMRADLASLGLETFFLGGSNV